MTARAMAMLACDLGLLLWPRPALEAAAFGVAAFSLAYGAVSLPATLGWPGSGYRSLAIGLAGIAGAASAFAWPNPVHSVGAPIVAGWAILVGGMQIVAAVRRRAVIADEWLRGVAGAATLLFGILLLVRPRLGGPAIAGLVGGDAIAFGALAGTIAIEARRRSRAAARAAPLSAHPGRR